MHRQEAHGVIAHDERQCVTDAVVESHLLVHRFVVHLEYLEVE